MKKKTKILITILLIILILLIVVKNVSIAAGYEGWNGYYSQKVTDRNVIIGQGNKGNNTYNISTKKTVQINQYDEAGSEVNNHLISILEQPHVYCAQYGAKLSGSYTNKEGKYVAYDFSVSDEITVTDPILAYIFCHGPSMSELEKNYATEDSQKALWYYLEKNTSTDDAKTINKGITPGDYEGKEPDLYKEAKVHKNNSASVSITNMSKEDDNVKISVSYNTDNYSVEISSDGKEWTKYGTSYTSKTLSIPQNEFSGNSAYVKVTAESKKYEAKYRLLTNAEQQRILVVTYAKTTPKHDSDDESIELNTNVSLQKYITKVNGNDITKTETALTTRINKKTVSTESDSGVKNAISKNNTATNYYKRNYPVKIEAGDTVTYRVYVYNNSNINAKSVLIKDCLPYYNDSNGNAQSYVSIVNIKKDGTTGVTWNLEDSKLYGNKNTYCYTLSDLAGGASTYFDITVRFNKFCDYIISNTAWISTTSPTNKKEYRTVDRDYIQMYTDYQVSLEKFVTEVTDGAGGNSVKYNDRDGKRYNEGSTYKDEVNYNSWKNNNKVEVEAGDIVTFTIRLKNTGTRNVKITSIYDTAINNSSGLSLVLADNSKATTNLEVYDKNGKKQSDAEIKTAGDYKGPNGTWELLNKNYKRYEINFKDATLLAPGDYVDLKIKFKVQLPTNLSTSSQTLFNKAGIVYLENKNSVRVVDKDTSDTTDGSEDNYDMDWLKTKIYKVSLEKFITEVTDGAGGNSVTYNDNDNDRSGKRYNKNAKSNLSENQKTDKILNNNVDGRVAVEPGDIVTYTIRLRNEGDTKVKINTIWETAEAITSGNKTGLKLVLVDKNGSTNLPAEMPLKILDSDGKEINNKVATIYTSNNKYKGPNNNLSEEFTKYERYKISFEDDNAILLDTGDTGYIDVQIKFKVEVPEALTSSSQQLYNRAGILELSNRNNENVLDSDGDSNNEDEDRVKTKIYKVSLKKIVYSVNNNTTGITSFDRWTSWESNEKIKNDENTAYKKYNNPVTVANGDTVTYAIKVKNDGTTIVKNIKVKDTLPNGLDLNTLEIVKITDSNNKEISKGYKNFNKSNKEVNFTLNTTLNPNETNTIYMSIKVTESNMSINVLKNYAEIIKEKTMLNRNGCDVLDSTADNNQDADYIQLKDIIISGTVWNDKALDKAQKYYNGVYDYQDEKENSLKGIKVELHRVGTGIVDTTTTDGTGRYVFNAENLDVSGKAKYIKASKNSDNNRWKEYYSYYITFEYDGITYTSTKFTEMTSDNAYDSNAKEDNGIIPPSGTRKAFNDEFSKINIDSNIEYDTVNKDGYIPQSVHKYDSKTMSIKSSTSKIDMSHTPELENQLMHVNLGLRGREIFDLELKTDVYSTKVTVNNVEGEYQYGNNRVTLRKADISVAEEDAANFASEERKVEVNNVFPESEQGELDRPGVNQGIRKADIKNNAYDVDKDGTKGDTGLKIEVTYKITVQNVSKTDGAVTKVTDYYDAKYNFIKAYIGNYEMTLDNKKAEEGSTGNGYKSVTLTTNGTNLTQKDEKPLEIYLVFELIKPSDTLSELTKEGEQKLPTFNIAEITEYTTKCGEGQTEYTRGLLDKDCAPGRINEEQVRLTTTVGQNTVTKDGDPTTLKYYFDGAMEYVTDRTSNKLNFLKYEDDTYAAPILYFVSPDDPSGGDPDTPDYRRTVTGIVFEDKTTTDPTTKVKTGDGVLVEGEVGIFGATVELVEINTNKSPKEIKENEGVVRFTTRTGKDGRFVIQDFLPGNYVIRYRYGNKTETVLLHQSGELNINGQSYNGEDYQSTNNTGNYIQNKLDETPNYWYIFNEKGISTATDNESRRIDVSNNVIIFTDEEMTVLNNMRAGKSEADAKVTYQENGQNKEVTVEDVINSTKMYATTPKMKFTVEQTINLDKLGDDVKSKLIKDELIVVNEEYSNLGEWAKFPDKDDDYYKEYKIDNMNFGIAEVPVTTIDLGKTIQGFTITDSTGSKVIVSVSKKEDGSWNTKGNVIPYPGEFDVSIEDDKLQGARLQVTYAITSEIWTEKNFDNKSLTVPTIEELVDYIDNNLSYNENLGENKKYWEITTLEEVKDDYKAMTYNNGTIPQGTADREGKKYTTIVRAKDDNPILLTQEGKGAATITLEKILSSTDSTFEEIITSTVDTFVYNNIIEITKLDYENYNPESDPEDTPPGDDAGSDPEDTPPDDVLRDRVRTPGRYIILPGVQHDTEISETITIHPPTGDSSINIIYYVMAVISLVILIAGVFGIKKFVIKK